MRHQLYNGYVKTNKLPREPLCRFTGTTSIVHTYFYKSFDKRLFFLLKHWYLVYIIGRHKNGQTLSCSRDGAWNSEHFIRISHTPIWVPITESSFSVVTCIPLEFDIYPLFRLVYFFRWNETSIEYNNYCNRIARAG